MSPLGEHFPESIKNKVVDAKLNPGVVIYLEVKFPQITKPKFLVLVADDEPDYWTFVVNSDISGFVSARPDLLRCQVKIDAASHDFLSHDSHIACHEVLRLKREDVLKELRADPSVIKGGISADVCAEIASAVKFAVTLSKTEKENILQCLACQE